jgi:TonB family protein
MKNFGIVILFLIPFLGNAQDSDTKKEENTVITIENGKVKGENEEEVFTIVENMPEFPGGQKALYEFLVKNLKYPAKAKKKGISGKVYVNFVIGKDGQVRDIKVIRGVHKLLDKEAIRVMKAMPKWKPGTQRGKNVNVSYNLPINFKLSRKDKKMSEKSK